jgi:hypothetical protein
MLFRETVAVYCENHAEHTYVCLFFPYIGSILIFFHDGSSISIIVCILFRRVGCVVGACENLSGFIRISDGKTQVFYRVFFFY